MLKPTKKITRREIKEDPLVTTYFKVKKFFNTYSKPINYGFLGLLALVAVLIFMGRSKRSAEVQANGKLGIAEFYYLAQDDEKAIQELTPIVETFSGTKSAGIALLYLGDIHLRMKNIDKAAESFQRYLDHYGDNGIMTASALAGLAATHEQRSEFVKAAELYKKAAHKKADSYASPFYLNDAARCHTLAGNREEAKSLYQAIVDRYPESPVTDEIKFRLEAM